MSSEEEIPPEAQPLTEEEEATMKAVREKIGDRYVDELMFIQFVRGYSYEEDWPGKVVEMLTKTLDWRAENNVDTICDTKLEKRDLFKETWDTQVTGVDPVGRLISVDRLGKIVPASLLESFTVEELQMQHVANQEYIAKMKRRSAAEAGLRLYKTVSIVDLDGVGMGHASSTFRDPAKSVLDIDQWFYPESMHKMYLVNVPWVFKMIWKIVRPWLHPITQSKIQVCGSNHLKELAVDGILPEQLPEFLGGSSTDKLAEFEIEYLANIKKNGGKLDTSNTDTSNTDTSNTDTSNTDTSNTTEKKKKKKKKTTEADDDDEEAAEEKEGEEKKKKKKKKEASE